MLSFIIIEDWLEIKKVLLDNFSGKFAWISDRINSYSIDPTLLLIPEIINNLDNFVCLAQVNYGKSIRDSTKIAEDFLSVKVPFKSSAIPSEWPLFCEKHLSQEKYWNH